MGFIILLALTTLSIAGTAAWFSVVGLSSIFAGTPVAVIIMGSVLELGKLVSASYVYRYWKYISFLMKTYLISAILILMLITSAGIFGQLSAGYQTDTLSLRDIGSQIELLETEKLELRERKTQIDDNLALINPNYITKRMELIDKLSPETNRINNRIPIITAEIHKLKSAQIQEESHVGPIIYIAKVFNKDTDDATKWMILLIIFAFDPLAVALTIATNNAILHRKKGSMMAISEVPPIETEDEVDEDPEFTFSERDLIEPVDDITLDIEPEVVPDEPEDAVDDHFNMEVLHPGKVEIVHANDVLSKLQTMYPHYGISDDAKATLQFFLDKRKEEGLTLHERDQMDRIIKTLQLLADRQ